MICRPYLFWFLGALVILVSYSAYPLSIGTITEKPTWKYSYYRELADYLQRRLGERVRVVFADSMERMRDLVENGEVDIFIDSLYPSLKVCLKDLCEPLLIRLKDGVRYYRSVIFVRSDSSVRSVKNLKGRMIAFDEPFSTSGYFVPIILLIEKGFRPIKLETLLDNVPEDRVGFAFAGDEENVVSWVFLRRTVAGAIGDVNLGQIAGKNMDTFRILMRSEEIPRHIVNFSSKLSKDKVQQIIKLLTTMHESAEGRRVLRRFRNTESFERLTDGDRTLIERFRNKMLEYGL